MTKIMVVDDAAFMRVTLRNILEKAGFEVEEAVDGQDAVKKYPLVKPDLVTMDITMPNMDGLEAATAIREKDPNAVILMCTALGQENMVRKAVMIGVKDFIVKPFDPDRVINAINTALGAAGS
jgi:two-component system chemotaxis response regulator CheY